MRTVGPVVRLELTRPNQEEVIEVELPRERYLQDPFRVGEQVFIRPRHLRVFLEDETEKLPAEGSAG